ncbi:hypothetical protein LL962_17325 [Xanthomonas sp. NCPPB 1067]|uniref:hypothetical protein n=1 Tax=Xanthomonas TaxID=338 RepID=UPI001E3B7818|nr:MULTISPECIES: hypothetical protein [Xanthomonas]MCC4588842.1 hypothetical protein [Xanthomonas sp. NCPPB 1067]
MTISQTPSLTTVQSVNRALDYIEVNLAGKLSLSLIAGAACVSPFKSGGIGVLRKLSATGMQHHLIIPARLDARQTGQ